MNFSFSKKSKGVAAIEAALTLPVICYLIFFILEAMKVNNLQSAIDSIATEASLDFISSKNTDNFASIVAKYKPRYITTSSITWYFDIYPDIGTMCGTHPYGGEEIFWPSADTIRTPSSEYLLS